MNTKEQNKFNQLAGIFQEMTKWNLARVKFLVSFIYALCKLQTVNFQKLAQGFGGTALADSNLRKIQRFFAGYFIDGDLIAKVIFSLLPVQPPYRLCLDRTNWKFGQANINILAISVCYQGIAIPLMWTMLPKRGNSSQKEREELIERYIRLFGAGSIEGILADREFIGDHWIGGLVALKIHFYFRIKGSMCINVPRKGEKKAFWLFNPLPINTAYHCRDIVKFGNQMVYLSGVKTIDKQGLVEFIIIATYCFNSQTMVIYRDRWQTETMFKAMKSSGFNIEDTHLTDLVRISKLLCLVCIAFVCVYQVGVYRNANLKPIRIKKHGRKAHSFLKYGLNYVAHALLCAVIQDIAVIVRILSCT